MLKQFVANLLHKKKSDIRRWECSRSQSMGINFIGPVEFVIGLTVTARGYISSIIQAGVPINVIPWRMGFEHAVKVQVNFPSTAKQPINIVKLNLRDIEGRDLLNRKPLRSLISPDCYNICIPFWELSSVYAEWHEIINQFDEIWCASSFMVRSLSAVTSRKVRLVRPSIDFSAARVLINRTDFGIPEDRFVFFYAADANSIMGRKNPGAFVDAYMDEFDPEGGACCLLKLSNSKSENPELRRLKSLIEERPDIIFLDAILSDKEMVSLYDCIDCYVSPHRSEGLGLTIIEAMAAQKPVIATPYGGATDFVTAETAFLIDYKLTEVGPGNEPYPSSYIWAEPKIESIQCKMREIFENPQRAKTVAQNGCKFVREMFSLNETSGIIRQELERIWCDGGRIA